MFLEASDIKLAISLFPVGSAGGMSGLRPQHLKDVTSRRTGDSGTALISSLTALSNTILAGEVPNSVRPFFAGANLSAFTKPGNGIRPIAVGETLRRLVAKCASRKLIPRFSTVFAPLNLGFGVPGGAEAAVHAARIFVSDAKSGDVFLKLDFRNAFNTIRRDFAAECIAGNVPELLPFFNVCYGVDSFLSFGDFSISSCEGLQQGDPLAVFVFCLCLHEKMCCLESSFRCGYIDDVSLGGSWIKVLEDFQNFRQGCLELGLELNESKCELTLLGDDHVVDSNLVSAFRNVCPSIALTPHTDLMLLGAPLGHDSLSTALEAKCTVMKIFTERLKLMRRHDSFFLLKNCLAIPKLLYTFRTAPCFQAPDVLKKLDDTILSAL